MARKRGLTWQLGTAFALVAVATAVIAGVTLSMVWQRQFESYVKQGLQDEAQGWAVWAYNTYDAYHGWPSGMQVSLSRAAVAGRRVQLFGTDGTKLFDVQDSSASAIRPPGATDAELPAGTIGAQQRVMYNGHVIGLVKVWSLSTTGLLNPRDLQFRDSSVKALLIAAAVAVMLASAAGVAYARVIVKPINQVTATASALRSGVRDARTGMSGEDPVGLLGRTLDEMADSVEADRAFERRMTADVAHELRTPLMAIQATVEGMQDGVLPADEEHLQTVRDETVRLARLADSILELARLERGAVPMAAEPMDPAAPLLAAVGTHRVLVDSAGLALTESVAEGMTICGDRDLLTQAFGNLLSNAARYTPASGTVAVRLEREGGEAVVTVADDGIGIEAEDLGRVFVRFWRADAARSRATGGLGVGLAVVKEIVERHRGTIAVESAPGVGTTFTVRLPLLPEPAPAPKPRTPFRRA